MKRKLALLILMILALSIALVACNGKEATEIAPRWQRDEEYTFNVNKADFSSKDTLMNGETFADKDEIAPLNAKGTYTLKIEQAGDTWKVTTKQVLYVQYAKSAIQLSDEDLAKVSVTDSTLFQNPEGIETVVLKSTSDTEVVFENDKKQTPISSKTELHGFYIGLAHQEVSGYVAETTYDFSDKRPLATVSIKLDSDEEAATYEKKFGRNASFIDYNQLLLYARSLDKPNGGFQDNPSVTVFNPYTRNTATASFALSKETSTLLTDSVRNETLWAKLDAVSVSIDGALFMQQINLPNLKSLNIDILHGGASYADKPKYTTVRFRVGYLSYELSQYDDVIWNYFTPAEQPAE